MTMVSYHHSPCYSISYWQIFIRLPICHIFVILSLFRFYQIRYHMLHGGGRPITATAFMRVRYTTTCHSQAEPASWGWSAHHGNCLHAGALQVRSFGPDLCVAKRRVTKRRETHLCASTLCVSLLFLRAPGAYVFSRSSDPAVP